MIIDPKAQGVGTKDAERCVYCFGSNSMCVVNVSSLSPFDGDKTKRESSYEGLQEALSLADEHLKKTKTNNMVIDEEADEPLEPETVVGPLPVPQDVMNVDEAMGLLDDIIPAKDRSKKTKLSKKKGIKASYIATESSHVDRINSESGYSSDSSSFTSLQEESAVEEHTPLSQIYPSQEKLTRLRMRIESLPDLDEMRTILLQLSSFNMNFDLIKKTRIGIAVANVMNDRNYERIHPFCEGILIHWIGVLPKDLLAELSDPVNQDQIKAPLTNETSARNWHDAMCSTFAEFMPQDTAAEVERVLYSSYGESTPTRFRKLVHALKTNISLREKLGNGKMTPLEFVSLPNESLNPTVHEKLRNEDHEAGDESSGLITEMFPCLQCGNKKCSYYEQQVRSGDEPMTIFLTCLSCKYSWSVNS